MNIEGDINPCHGLKGLGMIPKEPFPIQNVESLKWSLLSEDISLPAGVLDFDKLNSNLDFMDKFLSKYETTLLLAPHGKTTMMPRLFQKAIERPNVWGISLATPVQVQLAHDHGVSKIIMANQLVGQRNMEIISEIIDKDPNFEFMCLVDSPENVQDLGNFFKERNQSVKVLLEYGPDGGRTGIRNETQEKQVLSALKDQNSTVHLVGVEFYEGILPSEDSIREFIDKILLRAKTLYENGCFHRVAKPVTITGSGSAWYDIVAEKLSNFGIDNPKIPLQLILRPGCYMIHDVGLYTEISHRIKLSSMESESGESLLQPALTIWAYVQSIPEPSLAIIAFGKRDGAMDCGFPQPILHFRPKSPQSFPHPLNVHESRGWKVYKMMDQHSFMQINPGDDLRVGDILVFNIAHPCTTLDKWRNVLVMNDKYEIIDVYQTFF
jgi:D-serine dehydratase